MDGYAAWFQSLMTAPRRVYGVKLKPFSLIHTITLTDLGSPYVLRCGSAGDADTMIAAFVCARNWSQIRRDIYPDICKSKLMSFWLRTRFYNWKRQSDIMAAYMDDYTTVPEHSELLEKKTGRSMAGSPEHHIVGVLCSKYNMTLDEAWNTPFNLARCCLDIYAERQGSETLISRHDEMLNNMAKELREKAVQNGNS